MSKGINEVLASPSVVNLLCSILKVMLILIDVFNQKTILELGLRQYTV